jgi:hypothetical protein
MSQPQTDITALFQNFDCEDDPMPAACRLQSFEKTGPTKWSEDVAAGQGTT